MSDEHGKDDLDLNIDVEKRETLRRMIASAAFAVPVVASFPISGMMIDKALAFIPNQGPQNEQQFIFTGSRVIPNPRFRPSVPSTPQ